MSSAIVFLFVKWPEITWHTIAPYLHSSVKTVCHTVSLLTLLLDGEKTENSLQSAAHALKSIFWKVGFLFSFFSFPLTVPWPSTMAQKNTRNVPVYGSSRIANSQTVKTLSLKLILVFVSKSTKHSWVVCVCIYSLRQDVAATWLQLHSCYSDTMVMSLHFNDASVGRLRGWDISGQWVDLRMMACWRGIAPFD